MEPTTGELFRDFAGALTLGGFTIGFVWVLVQLMKAVC